MIALARTALVVLCLAPAAALAGGVPPEEGAFQPVQQGRVQPGGPKAPPQAVSQRPLFGQPEQRPNPLYVVPPPPDGGIRTAEQVRLRLQDICMYRSAEGDKPDETAPARCGCWSKTVAKTFAPDDIAAFDASDQMPEGVRERANAAWDACQGRRG